MQLFMTSVMIMVCGIIIIIPFFCVWVFCRKPRPKTPDEELATQIRNQIKALNHNINIMRKRGYRVNLQFEEDYDGYYTANFNSLKITKTVKKEL